MKQFVILLHNMLASFMASWTVIGIHCSNFCLFFSKYF